ncbi:heat shock factor 2-binding protein-like isoform X1 [Pocillopora verrucosa]|uniref:heat shock factor 2-binding protein-like isoform X1 n=1 Tax=Pocillopora verrucosa TaxID=203993 RepID=UPI003340D3AA
MKTDRNQHFLKVSRADVDQLVTEIMQFKEFLPKVLNSDLVGLYKKLDHCEQELEVLEAENRKLRVELDQMKMHHDSEIEAMKKQNNSLLEDGERYKEEKYVLKCQLSEASQQMNDQSDYCSCMGAAVCTLLWRVSRQQESVTSLLGGNKAEEFLQITSRTIESYFDSCAGGEEAKENSEEFQFVLALVGIITNMAAAAQGREFLVTKDSGRVLIDTFMKVLGGSSAGKNVKMRNLILMALYNVSINISGLQYITKKRGILGNLMQTIRGESDSELSLNAARLLQSIVMEPNSLTSEIFDSISLPVLQNLARTAKGELRDTLLEVMSDLQSYHTGF